MSEDNVIVSRINTNGSDVPDYQLMWQDQVKQNKHILADRDRWREIAHRFYFACEADDIKKINETMLSWEKAVRGA